MELMDVSQAGSMSTCSFIRSLGALTCCVSVSERVSDISAMSLKVNAATESSTIHMHFMNTVDQLKMTHVFFWKIRSKRRRSFWRSNFRP